MDLDALEQEIEKVKNKLQYPCIGIFGRTGTGKSTLIKEIFDIDTSNIKTGAGAAQTLEYKKYPDPPRKDKPLFLYDSAGYEAHEVNEYLEYTIDFLKKHSFQTTKSSDDNIHLVWYVIGGNTKRFEVFDKTVIKTIYELGIPVIIVITQVDILKSDELKAMKEVTKEYVETLSDSIEILEVSASPCSGSRIESDKEKLIGLVDKSILLLPVVYRDAFIYSQTLNIKAKRKVAWLFIGAAATAVYATSFIPFPGTTPVATIASQKGILRQLANLYNVEKYSQALLVETSSLDETKLIVLASFVIDIAGSTLGTLFAPAFIATQSLAGTLAASYIIILSFAYVMTIENLIEKYLNLSSSHDEIEQYIKEQFKKNFKFYSHIKLSRKEDIDKLGKDFIDRMVE